MKKVVKYLSICLLAIISCCLFSACGSNIKLKINFDSNGGTSCSAIYYEVGKSFNMPSDPTKENYIFDGWYEDDGTWEKPFTTNTILNYPLNKNMEITVYAKWLNKVHIIFESNGGSECERIYLDGKDIDLPTPTKDGSKFAGWYLDDDTFTSQFVNDGNLTPDENNCITLYAKWNIIHLVTFNSNGGENQTKYVENEQDIYYPTRDGYTFQGWYFDNGIWNNEFTIDSLNGYNNSEVTVYAKWKLNQYLRFDSNGGTNCERMLLQNVTEQNLPTPTKPLYLFVGWYTDVALNTPFLVSEVGLSEYISEMTVYAKWEKKQIQNVTFYGTPKTNYIYGEEFDANGMYANVEYYYYESEIVNITSNMISGFDTKKISLDKSVVELKGTIYIIIDSFSTYFEYSVSPKYKSIAIKPGSIKTEYLIGENSTTITKECDGSYYIGRVKVSAFRCTIIATNFDNTTEELEVIYFTDEQRDVNIICNHSYHNNIVIISIINDNFITLLNDFIYIGIINHPSIYDGTKNISKSTYLYENNSLTSYTTNAYCTLSTHNAGTFTATLYYGLCYVDFEYSVNYAEAEFDDFEQSTYEFVKECDNEETLYNQSVTIKLNNGREFTWKIDNADYIVSDFDFTTTGEKEALVNFPYIGQNSNNLLRIKYKVISLEDLEYIDSNLSFYQCCYQQPIKRDDISGKLGYYYESEELKSIYIYIPYDFDFGTAYLDLSNAGENFATINIAGVDVKVKYFVEEIMYVQLGDVIPVYYTNYIYSYNITDDETYFSIPMGIEISLVDLPLYAVYEDNSKADINNQIWYIGDTNSDRDQTEDNESLTETYFSYEILENIDTSTTGVKKAKILLCGNEFEINYKVIQQSFIVA